MTRDLEARPRGWLSLYAVAFGLMIGAGVALALSAREFLASIATLWVSSALSAAAIVVCLVGLWLPRRR